MVPFPMTLLNPNPIFKVTPFFDNEYPTNGYKYTATVTIEGE